MLIQKDLTTLSIRKGESEMLAFSFQFLHHLSRGNLNTWESLNNPHNTTWSEREPKVLQIYLISTYSSRSRHDWTYYLDTIAGHHWTEDSPNQCWQASVRPISQVGKPKNRDHEDPYAVACGIQNMQREYLPEQGVVNVRRVYCQQGEWSFSRKSVYWLELEDIVGVLRPFVSKWCCENWFVTHSLGARCVRTTFSEYAPL